MWAATINASYSCSKFVGVLCCFTYWRNSSALLVPHGSGSFSYSARHRDKNVSCLLAFGLPAPRMRLGNVLTFDCLQNFGTYTRPTPAPRMCGVSFQSIWHGTCNWFSTTCGHHRSVTKVKTASMHLLPARTCWCLHKIHCKVQMQKLSRDSYNTCKYLHCHTRLNHKYE